jgi:hypothetical protein
MEPDTVVMPANLAQYSGAVNESLQGNWPDFRQEHSEVAQLSLRRETRPS